MSEETFSLLVVDDEEFNRRIVARLLKKENYGDVEMAENGKQALEKLREKNFDAVLLDIEMPEMDGYGVLEHLQKDMRLRDIPVIMISGVEESESVIKCVEMGATDFLHKPFDPILLRARLGACLEKKRLRDQQLSHLSQLKSEKKKSDALLDVILPAGAANELKASGKVKPRRYNDVALLFCDIVGFTAYCEKHDAEEVVSGLQSLIEKFEAIADNYTMEKIKTIGDEFMASAGLLKSNDEPLLSAVKCGLDMIAASGETTPNWEVRVGVHLGPVVAGIVGGDKYQFDVWGDTVNTAARMAGLGAPGHVVMTYDAWLGVQDDCEGRSMGQLEVKGKGKVEIVECYGLR